MVTFFLSLDVVVISCSLVIFNASDVPNKQLLNIFLSWSYSVKNNTENDTNLNDGQTDWTLIAKNKTENDTHLNDGKTDWMLFAKNNTENDMNLNDGQTDWTLIAAICILIIVVAPIIIVFFFYIRNTSKLYRFTAKL